MTYWIDLFTAKTWAQAREYGFKVSGFRPGRRAFAKQVKVGDIFVCYLGGGISRWVGALQVEKSMYEASDPNIWPDDDFSIRFDTRPLVTLTPDTAIPVLDLAERLAMFRQLKNRKQYGWMFQGSPSRIKDEHDGEVILEALEAAEREPILRPVPDKLLARGSSYSPKRLQRATSDAQPSQAATTTQPHSEMQYLLLQLGSAMGLDVWVARNDKSGSWNGKRYADIARIRSSLPEQFDPRTQQVVELIDVLWLEGDAISSAFEVENSTNIYTGILRMSDLLARRPNMNIRLYLVAPDERRERVMSELARPTFAKLKLNQVCKFIPYSQLRSVVERFGDAVAHLKPDFIDSIAEECP